MNKGLISIYKSIVRPLGDRYENVRLVDGKKLIENSVINEKDFKFTNRIGVIETPARSEKILKKGDLVVVHHNVFRKFNNMQGKLVDGGSYVAEDKFACFSDQMFAYKRADNDWKSLQDYCFIMPKVQPQQRGVIYDLNPYVEQSGKVFINNPALEKMGINHGDEILFLPFCEYEFTIEGKLVYRMKWQDIVAKC